MRDSLRSMGISAPIVSMSIGYELRAANPIPYDIEYTKNLGYGAVRYLLKGGSGAMIVVFEGRIRSVPFVDMLDSKGRVKVRKVDISSEVYEVARQYMIRLEEEDFEGNRLKQLARISKMDPEAFKGRFSYILSSSRY